jgi:hypothetical protein
MGECTRLRAAGRGTSAHLDFLALVVSLMLVVMATVVLIVMTFAVVLVILDSS